MDISDVETTVTWDQRIPRYDEPDLCKMAWAACDAINPVAIAAELAAAMRAVLRAGGDTKAVCQHPAVLVLLDTLSEIVRREQFGRMVDTMEAYHQCRLRLDSPEVKSSEAH